MAEPSRKKQRRRLNYDKCQFCRHAKKACTPIERTWPQKCHRCIELGMECSENSRAPQAPPRPSSPLTRVFDIQELHDLSLRATLLRRLKAYERNVKAVIDARENLFGLKPTMPITPEAPDLKKTCEFIHDQETSLWAQFLNAGAPSNHPFAAITLLLLNTNDISFQDHSLSLLRKGVPKLMVDHLRESGDIGMALTMQEILLLDQCKNHEDISSTELQKYCDIYFEATRRLGALACSAIPELPPLHNLLLLARGEAIFPFLPTQPSHDYAGRSLLHLALDLDVMGNTLPSIEFDKATMATGDVWGRRPIHIACSGGSEAAAKYFLTYTVDIGVTDNRGCSAIHYASASGKESIIRLLIDESSANINSKDQEGFSPLMWAARCGHTAAVQLLLERGAEVNAINLLNQTPLIMAAKHGYAAIVQMLLDKDAEVNSEAIYGQTPLLLAVENGHTDTVQLLLQNGSNTEPIAGQTPLSVAAARGHLNITGLLLEKRANIDGGGDNYLNEALAEAVLNGHTAIIQLLLDNGATLPPRLYDDFILEKSQKNLLYNDMTELLRAATTGCIELDAE